MNEIKPKKNDFDGRYPTDEHHTDKKDEERVKPEEIYKNASEKPQNKTRRMGKWGKLMLINFFSICP